MKELELFSTPKGSAGTVTTYTLALFCFCLILLTASIPPIDYDSFWHLRMGMDLVQNQLSPWIDHYSFTYEGSPISGVPVAFQVGYYGLNWLFGDSGGQFAYKVFAFSALLLLSFWSLRQLKAPFYLYLLILPAVVVAIQYRAQIRPETVSYIFTLIALMFYRKAEPEVSVKTMLPVVMLMLIWRNYHSSIFGYVIFFGLFVDIGVRQLRERSNVIEWAKWAGWGLVVVLVGYLGRNLRHPALSKSNFSENWKVLISEYKVPVEYLDQPSVYGFILIAIATMLLSVQQKRIGYLIILFVLINASLTMTRMVSFTVLVTLILFAHVATEAGTKASPRNRILEESKPVKALTILLISLMAGDAIKNAYSFYTSREELRTNIPTHLVNYMKETGRHGRIFNQYRLGGYLLYRLSPDSTVYIDGRTNILYPLEHAKRYNEVKSSAAEFIKESEKYDFDFAILEYRQEYSRNMFYAGYGLDFSDAKFGLFSKEKANFPLLGRAWAVPYCWNEKDLPELRHEAQLAESILQPSSIIFPLAQFILEFDNAKDKPKFLAAYNKTKLHSDASKRFYFYRAIEQGVYSHALEVMYQLDEWVFKDTLAEAFALLRMKNFAAARDPIVRVIRIPPKNVEFNDLVVQQAIMEEFTSQVEPQPQVQDYLSALTTKLGERTLTERHQPLSSKAFCEPGLESFYANN